MGERHQGHLSPLGMGCSVLRLTHGGLTWLQYRWLPLSSSQRPPGSAITLWAQKHGTVTNLGRDPRGPFQHLLVLQSQNPESPSPKTPHLQASIAEIL